MVEEAAPPDAAELAAELSALGIRSLVRRAEQLGVDDEKLETAKDNAAIVALIMEKAQESGLFRLDAKRELSCLRPEGHTIGKLARFLNTRLVVVSTPEFGPGPSAGEFSIPVMSGLERLVAYVFPLIIAAYDFKGSAAAEHCGSQWPDRELRPEDWTLSSTIHTTQWFSYWSGRVRAALSAVVYASQPVPVQTIVHSLPGSGSGFWAEGTRTAIAVSISGGPVTQKEKAALPDMISGTLADLSTRDLDIGDIKILWLHFESLEDFLKALQGYGGVDVAGDMFMRNSFGLPGRWVDGSYDEQDDLLTNVPGDTPQERRAFLLTALTPTQELLDSRLVKAIRTKSVRRVRELLGLAPDNTMLPEDERPLCANPNFSFPDGCSMFHFAAQRFNLQAMEALLAAGANPKALDNDGDSALDMAIYFGKKAPLEETGVPELVDAVIELCAQAQFGTSYADYLDASSQKSA
eukprot:COSAG02_NODE_7314_length_3069_cov_2.031650_1_plen_465_part_00